MPSIKLSAQTYDEFERLKAIMSQMLDKDDIEDDQVIASLVGGFLESLSHEMVDHMHMPASKGSCCGGTCNSHDQHEHPSPKQGCCGGACGGHHH